MKRRSPEETRNRINRLSEALFGAPEEIDEEEAEELLSEAGVDAEALNERMYKRLYAEAQKYWIAGKDLPPLLKKSLEDLRPLSSPPRNEAELARQARTGVEGIVKNAKLLGYLIPDVPVTFAEAYRNKKELTDKDRKSLDSVQEELKRKIERLKGKDDKSR